MPHIGRRATGSTLVAGNRCLAAQATIAADPMLITDPVDKDLLSLADVGIGTCLPETIPASFQLSGRYASQTNYISPLGNFSAEDAMPVGKIVDDWYILSGLAFVTEATTVVTLAIICRGIDDIRNRMGDIIDFSLFD